MKTLFALALSFIFSLSASCSNDVYETYCSEMNKKMGVELSFSDGQVEVSDSIPVYIFTFGESYNGIAGLPMFEGKAIVTLSEQNKAVIMDLSRVQSQSSKSNDNRKRYYIPGVTSWMLNNCDAPWAMWYINNAGGVITEDDKKLSEEEQAVLKRLVSDLRTKHERQTKDKKLAERVNCNSITIVAIPNIDNIEVNKFDPNLPNTAIKEKLMKNGTRCYAVEFYKQSVQNPLQMLFFIDESTTIDDCVAEMAEYIRFR